MNEKIKQQSNLDRFGFKAKSNQRGNYWLYASLDLYEGIGSYGVRYHLEPGGDAAFSPAGIKPEAVIQLTIFFSQTKYLKRQYKVRKDYYRIYAEQREKEWREWEDEAVDESELVTIEGYTLTPEEHARRMEIRNRHDNYIPAIVVEHFKSWKEKEN